MKMELYMINIVCHRVSSFLLVLWLNLSFLSAFLLAQLSNLLQLLLFLWHLFCSGIDEKLWIQDGGFETFP